MNRKLATVVVVALVIAVGWVQLCEAQETHKVASAQVNAKLVSFGPDEKKNTETLNKLAKEGWEWAGPTFSGEGVIFHRTVGHQHEFATKTWEFKAIHFGSDKKQNDNRFNEMQTAGWYHVGPDGKGMVAFARPVRQKIDAQERDKTPTVKPPTTGLSIMLPFTCLGPAETNPGKLIASANAARALKTDLERLQGKWEVVGRDWGKGLMPGNKMRDRTWVIAANRFKSLRMIEVCDAGLIIKLDEEKNPKEITLSNGNGPTALGIYRIEGDTLTSCMRFRGGVRPGSFKATEDGLQQILVYKRGSK